MLLKDALKRIPIEAMEWQMEDLQAKDCARIRRLTRDLLMSIGVFFTDIDTNYPNFGLTVDVNARTISGLPPITILQAYIFALHLVLFNALDVSDIQGLEQARHLLLYEGVTHEEIIPCEEAVNAWFA